MKRVNKYILTLLFYVTLGETPVSSRFSVKFYTLALNSNGKIYKLTPSNQVLTLKSLQNRVYFKIDNTGSNTEYRLDGVDSGWIRVFTNQSIHYVNLPGNEYEFKVRDKHNLESIRFIIDQPFWQKWWFLPSIFVYILLVFGAVYYIFFYYRLRQQFKMQSVRHELEIKALRAQMNPHFIFNCMNTIDAYILRKKFLEASDFLQKFSKLIRKILENSENQTISIEQEIQTLKLYIELEQERFSNSFVSYFDIEPELMTKDYQIPSLIFQPFVENAILHGIRHLTDRKGLVSVELKKIKGESGEGILFCVIQDNGIGKKASSVINAQRQTNHKSMGVNVTLERIKTYQAIYGTKMEIIVTDLEEGTKVEIKLPLFIGD